MKIAPLTQSARSYCSSSARGWLGISLSGFGRADISGMFIGAVGGMSGLGPYEPYINQANGYVGHISARQCCTKGERCGPRNALRSSHT